MYFSTVQIQARIEKFHRQIENRFIRFNITPFNKEIMKFFKYMNNNDCIVLYITFYNIYSINTEKKI